MQDRIELAGMHVPDGPSERQSSSGIVVSTGTGCTGWARSIAEERQTRLTLPGAVDPTLAFFVREAWPSIATETSLTEGLLGPDDALVVISEMDVGGVIFGDGIESDHPAFGWGTTATVCVAEKRLHLLRD